MLIRYTDLLFETEVKVTYGAKYQFKTKNKNTIYGYKINSSALSKKIY